MFTYTMYFTSVAECKSIYLSPSVCVRFCLSVCLSFFLSHTHTPNTYYRCQLTRDHSLHILHHSNGAYVLSLQVSEWFWDSDLLQSMLRQVTLTTTTKVLKLKLKLTGTECEARVGPSPPRRASEGAL